jgi:hypothetical protein
MIRDGVVQAVEVGSAPPIAITDRFTAANRERERRAP